MARPPSSLPPSGDAPLAVSLILGSFTHDPARLELFNLAVPPSAPVAPHPDATAFALRPEITHTFRPEPKVPAKFISATFAGLVLAPWVVLLGLVRYGSGISFLHQSLKSRTVGLRPPERTAPIQPQHPPLHCLPRWNGSHLVLVLVGAAPRPGATIRLPRGDPHRLHWQKCTGKHVVRAHRKAVDKSALSVLKYILACVLRISISASPSTTAALFDALRHVSLR